MTGATAAAAAPPEPLAQLEDVRFSYTDAGQRREILHGIDLRIEPGETLAVVGRSGSGKSTLLNVIGGLARPSAGRVHVAGHDLAALDERARTLLRRRTLGFVYQFFNLIDTLSVADNVLLPLELDGRLDADARGRTLALLDEVGLASRGDAFPDQLSGGEQQRVALVRALAHGPALVLADEPTGNLDSDTGERVLELLERLLRQAGHGLLLVTHSREVAARADRVLHLADGRLTDPA